MSSHENTLELLTIGHGKRSLDEFLGLLKNFEVTAIADVRTTPVSRWAPWFNKEALSKSLADIGVSYVFLGETLGGRPQGDDFYTDDGHVKYRRLSKSSLFQEGFERLISGASQFKVAVLCSESDHRDCHRNLLIARVAEIRGVRVLHIGKDGAAHDFDNTLLGSDQLFSNPDEDEWISAVKVR